MAKCINCVHYPWVSHVDPGMMPPMQCDSKLAPRNWTKDGVDIEHSCPHYKGSVGAQLHEPFVGDARTDGEPFVASEASYPELTEKAKELGIPFVGVKREVLAAEIEALLNKGGDQDDAD